MASSSAEGYDVYVDEPQRLEEGVRKHTLSVFVADEAGLINRVAGVFARRNANIESLAVGLTVDKALFTIVATGTDPTVANLCKQLAKLVNVRFVEDITDTQHTERELVLVKVRAPPGPARTEITQLATIFRARVVDVGEATFTMSVTGDPGKVRFFFFFVMLCCLLLWLFSACVEAGLRHFCMMCCVGSARVGRGR